MSSRRGNVPQSSDMFLSMALPSLNITSTEVQLQLSAVCRGSTSAVCRQLQQQSACSCH